ncbi:sulfur carrier protein ThiS [Nocardioides sp. SOB44]|jgi:sulfur carrier protein|uniref:Sulfur carrier protein ThiS n=2 Tax=root TaxID=1 RepID=A0ABT8TWD3_9ACTN|nr:sulfur carrier protein ThiS [Nocardioides cremeus]MDO3397649.1 sulfur carrier protein ThiS [Nocardioides cremeus]MSY84590.1 sulfur carrier protein ThiS [Actinomycetota bacterium]
MRINLNGQPRFVEEGATLQDVLPSARGVAAALNGSVVPAASWESTPLSEDDAVELVTAHQGG